MMLRRYHQKKDESFDFESATVKELKAYAAERSVDLGDAKKKADIVAILTAPAEPEDEPTGLDELEASLDDEPDAPEDVEPEDEPDSQE